MYPVFAATFFEKTGLSPFNGLGTLAKNQLTTIVKVPFWTLNTIPLIYMPILMPRLSLITVVLRYILKSGSVSPPTFFFISKIVLDIWAP